MQARLTVFAQWLVIAMPVLLFCGKVTSDIVMSVIAALFLVHSSLYGNFLWLRDRWMQVALTLTGYMCLRAIITENPTWFNLGYAFTWVRFPVAGAALAYWLLPDQKVRRNLLIGLTAALVFILADCMLQFFTGTDLFGHKPFPCQGLQRLTGPFSNPRPGITLVWLIFPVLLGWGMKRSPSWATLISAATLVIVFLTGERMALLLLLMGVGILMVALPRYRVMLVVGCQAALLILHLLVQERPEVETRQVKATHAAVVGFSQTSYGLTALSAARIFTHNPVFGSGVMSFRTECPKPEYGPINDPQQLQSRCPLHPHNLYLAWLSEYGLVGFTLYFLMAGFWLLDLFRVWRFWIKVPLVMGLVVTLFIRLWPISVGTSHFSAWSAVPFWLLMGWLYSYLVDYRKRLKSGLMTGENKPLSPSFFTKSS